MSILVTYLTADDVLVSVRHLKSDQWEALVEGMQGRARFGTRDLQASPGWSTERVARHALEWAQSLPDTDGCPCPDPECPGKALTSARDVFGPTEPRAVDMTGPWIDGLDMARVAAALQCGEIDEDEADEYWQMPTLPEIIAKIEGKSEPRQHRKSKPSDPHSGSTWRLG